MTPFSHVIHHFSGERLKTILSTTHLLWICELIIRPLNYTTHHDTDVLPSDHRGRRRFFIWPKKQAHSIGTIYKVVLKKEFKKKTHTTWLCGATYRTALEVCSSPAPCPWCGEQRSCPWWGWSLRGRSPLPPPPPPQRRPGHSTVSCPLLRRHCNG